MQNNLREQFSLLETTDISDYYQYSYLFELFLARFIIFTNNDKFTKDERMTTDSFLEWLKYKNEVPIGGNPFPTPKYFKMNYYQPKFCEHIFLEDLFQVDFFYD